MLLKLELPTGGEVGPRSHLTVRSQNLVLIADLPLKAPGDNETKKNITDCFLAVHC